MFTETPTDPFAIVRKGSAEETTLQSLGWVKTDHMGDWAHYEPPRGEWRHAGRGWRGKV